jgi:hypothetical protein
MNAMLADTVKQPARAVPRTGKASASATPAAAANRPKPAMPSTVTKPVGSKPTSAKPAASSSALPAKTPNSKRLGQQRAIQEMEQMLYVFIRTTIA